MKKYLTILFSIYFTALSVLPCQDKEDCKDISGSEVAYAATDHSDHEQDTESCSPFCVCNCCGQSVGLPKVFFFNIKPLLELAPVNTVYKSSFVKSLSFDIWQPPKLS